jgi:hypothetical protein
MTETRGWTAPQYERWLADTLIWLLLAADLGIAGSGPEPVGDAGQLGGG